MATKKGQEKVKAVIEKARKEAVETIIDMMENEELNWVKEWENGFFMPRNGATNRPYHGGNIALLAAKAYIKGYEDNRWYTFKQAEELGYMPRKGEKAAIVEKWSKFSYAKKTGEVDENGEDIKEMRSYLKPVAYFPVFNAEQLIDMKTGEPMPKLEKPKKVRLKKELCEIADRLIETSRCAVHEAKRQTRAYYSPWEDSVHMPDRRNFASMNAFISVLTHEMTHSTMKPMNRYEGGHFGDSDYAYEELIAELGSTFVCMHLNVHRLKNLEHDENFKNHAAYLKSWLQSFRDKPNTLFKAMAEAEKASDFIIERYEGKDKQEKAA